MNKAWILGAALVVGCGGNGNGKTPDASTTKMDAAPDGSVATMTINGVGTVHAQTDTGVVDGMVDFSSGMANITTITPNGTAFDHNVGMGMANGTFTALVDKDASSWDLSVSFNAMNPPFYLV